MRAFLVLGFVSLVGCKKTPSCDEAIDKILKMAEKTEGKADPGMRDELVGKCVKQKWSDELRKCIADATDEKSVDGCKKLAPPKPPKSPTDVASMTVKKYAFEAFPQWAMAHPDKACPDRLADLDEYMEPKPGKDAWGNDYRMFCGTNLPAGAKGLAVMSPGEDGKEGTTDDIKSWE